MAQYVEDLIAQRGLAAGAFLSSKTDLQTATGVARSTVGEALKILAERQVVFMKPGPRGGVFVADPSAGFKLKDTFVVSDDTAAETADAMALRDLLEPTILRDAALHRVERDIAELREIMQAAREHPEDAAPSLELIWRLHRRIGEITPNRFLRTTYIGIIDVLREHTTPAVKPSGGTPQGYGAMRVEAHVQIVDAIEQGDTVAVEKALAMHDAFGN